MAKKEPSAKTPAAKKPSATPVKAASGPKQAPAAAGKAPQPQATAGKPALAGTARAKAAEPKAAPSAAKQTPQRGPAKSDAMIKAVGAPGAEPPKHSKPAPGAAAPKHEKLAIDRAIDEAREAVFSVRGHFGSSRPGADPAVSDEHAATIASLTNLNTKLVAAFRANAEATLDHVQAIASARSVSQLLELNGRFVRDQLIAFNTQAKEIAAASFELVSEAGKPPRDNGGKAAKPR